MLESKTVLSARRRNASYPIVGKSCRNCGAGFKVRLNWNGRKRKLCDWCRWSGRRLRNQHGLQKTNAEEVGHLYFVAGLSGPVIAEKLGISFKTVYRHLWKLNRPLRKRTVRKTCAEPGCDRPVFRRLVNGYMAGTRCRYHHRMKQAEHYRNHWRRKRGIPPERWRVVA